MAHAHAHKLTCAVALWAQQKAKACKSNQCLKILWQQKNDWHRINACNTNSKQTDWLWRFATQTPNNDCNQINLTSSSTTNARNEQQTKKLEPKNNNGKHTNDQTHIHTAHCQHKQQRQHAHSSLPTCSKTPTTKLPRRTSTPQLSRRNSWQQTLQPTTNSHSTQITRTHGRRTIDRAN